MCVWSGREGRLRRGDAGGGGGGEGGGRDRGTWLGMGGAGGTAEKQQLKCQLHSQCLNNMFKSSCFKS